MASSGITNPTPLSRRRIDESLALKFTDFYRGLSPEKQQALKAILQQAVQSVELAGFPRTGDGIGALRATQEPTE